MSFTFIKNYFISRSRNKNKVMYLKQENQYSIFDEYDVALYNRIFILNIVKNMNVRDKVHLLIEQANEHGGHDNIAAVLIEGGR